MSSLPWEAEAGMTQSSLRVAKLLTLKMASQCGMVVGRETENGDADGRERKYHYLDE